MADFPFLPARPDLRERLGAAFDAEGKIARAVVALGAPGGADVVLLGAAPDRAAGLRDAGARVREVSLPDGAAPAPDAVVAAALGGLPPASADLVVALWSAFEAPAPAALAAADGVLRPGGRLVVVQDYGRDDLDALRGSARTAELVASSRRDGWYLAAGFRIRVIHAFWTAATLEEAADLLEAAYGPEGRAAAGGLRRPRVAHNVAVYHRVRPG